MFKIKKNRLDSIESQPKKAVVVVVVIVVVVFVAVIVFFVVAGVVNFWSKPGQ